MPPDSPEPAAALLGLLGAAGVGVTRWRRRAA
jgi:MYXO-CTERM domain-containing protein